MDQTILLTKNGRLILSNRARSSIRKIPFHEAMIKLVIQVNTMRRNRIQKESVVLHTANPTNAGSRQKTVWY